MELGTLVARILNDPASLARHVGAYTVQDHGSAVLLACFLTALIYAVSFSGSLSRAAPPFGHALIAALTYEVLNPARYKESPIGRCAHLLFLIPLVATQCASGALGPWDVQAVLEGGVVTSAQRVVCATHLCLGTYVLGYDCRAYSSVADRSPEEAHAAVSRAVTKTLVIATLILLFRSDAAFMYVGVVVPLHVAIYAAKVFVPILLHVATFYAVRQQLPSLFGDGDDNDVGAAY